MLLLSVQLPTASSMLTVSPQLETVLMSFAVALPEASLDGAYTAALLQTATQSTSHTLLLMLIPNSHPCFRTLCPPSAHHCTEVQVEEGSARVHPWCKPLSTSILSVVVSLTPISACVPS